MPRVNRGCTPFHVAHEEMILRDGDLLDRNLLFRNEDPSFFTTSRQFDDSRTACLSLGQDQNATVPKNRAVRRPFVSENLDPVRCAVMKLCDPEIRNEVWALPTQPEGSQQAVIRPQGKPAAF